MGRSTIRSSRVRTLLAENRNDLIVLATLLLVVFLLVEQSIRFWMYGADSFSYRKMDSIGSLRNAGFLQASSDPGILYELKPDLDSYYKLADFRTNSRGLRDREYPLEKPPATFRVAVIGGSYTMPSGVALEDAYHSILEDRLNRESPGRSHEFINFGVGGYATKNKLATLRRKVLEYRPDLILFVLDGTKLADETGTKRRFVPKERETNFFQSFAWQLFLKSPLVASLSNDRESYLEKQRKSLAKLDGELQELAEISRAHSTPICVVELDHDPSSARLAEAVGDLVRKNGLHFANTVPAFAGVRFRDSSVDPLDPHPNPAAHRIFAQALYDDLKRQALLGDAAPGDDEADPAGP